MSQWGVFYDDRGYVHVAPSSPEGVIVGAHQLSPKCPCDPKPAFGEFAENDHILVHQDPERGGTNA